MAVLRRILRGKKMISIKQERVKGISQEREINGQIWRKIGKRIKEMESER